MAIRFFFEQRNISLTNRTGLKRFITAIFKGEKKKLSSINYIFCSDGRLLKINQAYLKHNYFTDIITFMLSEPGDPIEGEIYISIDRIRENALIHEVTIKEELHRVIFHGVLHLCGYKDKSGNDKNIMRRVESKYLDLYFK